MPLELDDETLEELGFQNQYERQIQQLVRYLPAREEEKRDLDRDRIAEYYRLNPDKRREKNKKYNEKRLAIAEKISENSKCQVCSGKIGKWQIFQDLQETKCSKCKRR